MNHVVAVATGLVLDQPSFFSTRLKKLILPPSVSIFNFLLSSDPYPLQDFHEFQEFYRHLGFIVVGIFSENFD